MVKLGLGYLLNVNKSQKQSPSQSPVVKNLNQALFRDGLVLEYNARLNSALGTDETLFHLRAGLASAMANYLRSRSKTTFK